MKAHDDTLRHGQVGQSARKCDGLSLAVGAEKFVADELPPGTLVARILTSPYAHARIKDIDTTRAQAIPGVWAVLTYKDLPRVAHTTAGQGYPEPSAYDTFTLDHKVRFIGDRVAAVAAETADIAAEALAAIHVEWEELPALLDPAKAMDSGAPILHDEPEARMPIPVPYDPGRNMAAQVSAAVGDIDQVLAASDVVVQREFSIHQASHCCMEPHVAAAWLDPRGRIVIRTSTQVPFHVRRIVAQRLEVPISRIRVIKPRIGGGFGGKQEVLLEDIVAALAMKTRRPVLLEYSRQEEFISSRTRHPQLLKVRAGANRDGKVTGYDLDIIMNTGAYGSHALTVVCNSGSKTLPLYRFQAIRFLGTSVYTNLPVGGAYRGYGATQAYFPLECVMDELAEKVGMDPVAFRQQNHIKEGEGSPIFAALGEGKPGVEQKVGSNGLAECIRLGAEAIEWDKKRGQDRHSTATLRRGVGMAALMQGSSIPEIDMASAYLKMNEDGGFNLMVGATDLGTGSDTILAQIAAETLGTDSRTIHVYSSDTDLTPFDVGAYASSTTYLTGAAVIKAAEDVRQQVLEVASRLLEVSTDDLDVSQGAVVAADGRTLSFGEICTHAMYVGDQFQIQATASHISHKSPPPFSAHFVEVEVDTETGKVRVLKYVAAVDCGTAINPQLAEGQTEGAVLNGISYALTEEYLFDSRGRMRNPDFNHYKIFSTADLPELQTILVPTWEKTGPFGAKSVSEIGINGPIPAIANAIYDAVGIRLTTSPFTAERVLNALKEQQRNHSSQSGGSRS
jgi:probable selenate reductase molybdenum-binding subunit